MIQDQLVGCLSHAHEGVVTLGDTFSPTASSAHLEGHILLKTEPEIWQSLQVRSVVPLLKYCLVAYGRDYTVG